MAIETRSSVVAARTSSWCASHPLKLSRRWACRCAKFLRVYSAGVGLTVYPLRMGSRLRTFWLIALLTILGAGGMTQQATDSAKAKTTHTAASRMTVIGVGNFAK